MAGKANMIKRNSRCYNREQFIAKAKAIHGDLYDYSDTVLSGSQDPVSFKCNRCGTTRTLSQAGSHIRKIRPCGCKPCNHDRLSPCKICGVSVSSKVYHAQAKRCKACCDNTPIPRPPATASLIASLLPNSMRISGLNFCFLKYWSTHIRVPEPFSLKINLCSERFASD